MRELSDAEWLAFQAKAPGPMLYGVISTGIYCRAGCPARRPLRKNIRWLDSTEAGRASGMRACKRCKPDDDGPVKSLDCLDLLCPLPVLKARKALNAMQAGSVLQIWTSDRMALIDLPHFCAEAGHAYLGATESDGQARHLIRRGLTAPDAGSRSPGSGP